MYSYLRKALEINHLTIELGLLLLKYESRLFTLFVFYFMQLKKNLYLFVDSVIYRIV